MGVLTASTATGSLIFLPLMARLSESGDWRPVVWVVTTAMALLLPLAWIFVRERPEDLNLARYGEAPQASPAPTPPRGNFVALRVLRAASRSRAFWMLFAGFFVCGMTTNGLVGTHLIAFCGDRGIAPVTAASWLALMGVFDIVGATASGWLSDRYDPRKLLFAYFSVRGLSLLALPSLDLQGLSLTLFVIFFGLDWIATVPPTLRLANAHFGEADGPIIYGWIFTGHQAGAATAAIGAGLIRDLAGEYASAFLAGGVLALAVALVFIMWRRPEPTPSSALA
jgi:predicted MFS family arabinose efflux permease